MKKGIGFLLMLLLLMLGGIAAAADLVTEGDFIYSVQDDKAILYRYTGNATEVVVPGTLGGKPVSEIDNGAFQDCAANLASISLPDSLEQLKPLLFRHTPRAFYIKCTPNSVAEKTALKYGLQYDNGVKQVIGYNIVGYKEKARWIISNYIPGSLSDRQKVERVHNWLIYNAGYDYTYTNYHPIGVLTQGNGVCQSYATATQVLLDMLGIPNVLIYGNVVTSTEGHAWNAVRIGSTWYQMDNTWDDGGYDGISTISGLERSDFFLLSDAGMARDHTWDSWFSTDRGTVVGRFSDGMAASYIDGDILYHPDGIFVLDRSEDAVTLSAPFDSTVTELQMRDTVYHSYDMYYVRKIADGALSGMVNLKKLTTGMYLTDIGKNALKDCTALTDVRLEGVEVIGDSAFAGCTSLQELYLGGRIQTIGRNAFLGCSRLQKVVYFYFVFYAPLDFEIQAGNEALCNALWYNSGADDCVGYPVYTEPEDEPTEPTDEITIESLKYKLSGKTATVIGPKDKNARELTIPDTITANGTDYTVTAIDGNACKGMKKLASVRIGKNIKTIGKNAFADCAKLKAVTGGAGVVTIKDGAFSGCKALKTFPTLNKLQKIGANAFKGDKTMDKFTLAKSVNSIGKNAFNGCAGLKTITVKSEKLTAKNIGAGAFKGINKKATFKCPKKQLKAYKKLFVKKGAPKTCKFK